MTRATACGCLVVLIGTRAAPPGMPVHAAGPQGLATACQSKLLPMVLANCGNLPGAGHVQRHLAVGELLVGAAIRGAAHRAPQRLRHRAVFVPAGDHLHAALETVIDERRLVASHELGAHGDGRAGHAMPGAIHGNWVRCLYLLGDLTRRLRPVVPGRFRAGHGNARLLEERRIDDRQRQSDLGHEAVDAVLCSIGRAHPGQHLREILVPVLGVLQQRTHIEIVARRSAQIGDAGHVGSLATAQQRRKLLHDSLVRHPVQQ